MQSIKVTVPAPSSEQVTNLLAVAGMAGTSVSVGALAGNWWCTLLVASVFMIVLAYIAQSHAAAEVEQAADVDEVPPPAAADTTLPTYAEWAALDRVATP